MKLPLLQLLHENVREVIVNKNEQHMKGNGQIEQHVLVEDTLILFSHIGIAVSLLLMLIKLV